jgi:hypothetical protein
MVDLIRESSYLKNSVLLTVDSLESVLRSNPPLINAWLRYSEDKRTSRGWYLAACALVGGDAPRPVAASGARPVVQAVRRCLSHRGGTDACF